MDRRDSRRMTDRSPAPMSGKRDHAVFGQRHAPKTGQHRPSRLKFRARSPEATRSDLLVPAAALGSIEYSVRRDRRQSEREPRAAGCLLSPMALAAHPPILSGGVQTRR
jgi:hypothetical protein